MSFNGSGLFQINSSGQPVVSGTTISSTTFNTLTADLGTGLSTAICKDGQTTVTANIPFAGFRLTGIGAPAATGDALREGSPIGGTTPAAVTGTTATFSGLLTSTIGNDGQISAATATTGYLFNDVNNTGGRMRWGIEGATPGLFTGTSAYAGVSWTTGATALQFGTNSIVRVTISSAGTVGITNIAGTGSRPVYADANGVLSAPGTALLTNSLSGDVALSNTGTYFTGPTVAQGSTGTWFASGTVTLLDASIVVYKAKLWDGTTVIASAQVSAAAGFPVTIALSGYLASPAGNLRISVNDASTTAGNITFNTSGNSKDSTLTAFRIA